MDKKSLCSIINESVNRVLKENFGDIEDIAAFDVFTENISLTEIRSLMEKCLYDEEGNYVGCLSDFYFKYDPSTNDFL